MGTKSLSAQASRDMSERKRIQTAQQRRTTSFGGPALLYQFSASSHKSSHWSLSWRKRAFDILTVLLTLPFVLPVLIAVALAVRLTSLGPVLFTQRRIGRKGRPFTILKFRTMEHARHRAHRSVTTARDQRFTLIGPLLRRWKLDELPQLLNVLRGDMSLVGPRPKLPEHQIASVPWRPGITGSATFAFAREEEFLASVPAHQLDFYYHRTILPAKHKLDSDYMSRASFQSDLKLLLNTIFRRWGKFPVENLLKDFEKASQTATINTSGPAPSSSHNVLSFDPAESVASGD